MAHIQFTSWHEPNSLPIFFETIWPGLTPEAQQSLHKDLYPYLIRHVEPPAGGGTGSSAQAIPSLPTALGDNGSSIQAVRPLPPTQEHLAMRLSPPSSQHIPSHQTEENATTSRPLLEPPIHASRPKTRRSQRLPAFQQVSNKQLANMQQHTNPPRMTQGKATKATTKAKAKAKATTASVTIATTASSLPDISAPCNVKTPTNNLLLHHTTILEILVQPSRESFHSPFTAQDALNILSQSTQSRHQKVSSDADAENIWAVVLESAQAFFESHGQSMRQCKDMIDNKKETESTMMSASIALRFHYLAFTLLRNHLVGHHVTHNAAKSQLVETLLAKDSGLAQAKMKQMVTDDLSRGQKYLTIIENFSISTVVELNPKCSSIYEQRTISEAFLERLWQEGAKTRLEFKNEAPKDVSNHIKLEILATCYLSWMYYQYHLSYFPHGCWAQDCRWRANPANKNKDNAASVDERGTECCNDSNNQITYARASRSRDSSYGETQSGDNTPRIFPLAAIALQESSKALLTLASLIPAKVTSLVSFIARSRKRLRDCNVPIPTGREKNAAKSRSRAPIASAPSPSTTQPLERQHDVHKPSIPAQPPTHANYETHLNEADTLSTFRSDSSILPPGDLNAGGGYAYANDAAQDDSTSSLCVDDSRLGIPTDYFTLDNMPSRYPELTSADVYAPANDAAQDDSTSSLCVDDLRLGIPTDYFTLDNMPSRYPELTSADVYAPANDAAQDDSTSSLCVDDLRLGIPTDYFTLNNML